MVDCCEVSCVLMLPRGWSLSFLAYSTGVSPQAICQFYTHDTLKFHWIIVIKIAEANHVLEEMDLLMLVKSSQINFIVTSDFAPAPALRSLCSKNGSIDYIHIIYWLDLNNGAFGSQSCYILFSGWLDTADTAVTQEKKFWWYSVRIPDVEFTIWLLFDRFIFKGLFENLGALLPEWNGK